MAWNKKSKKYSSVKLSKPFKKKYLVIVESPAKAKTIEKFLGKDFGVLASMGHIRDLPKSTMAVDVENNFEPRYIVIKGKAPIIKQLKAAAKKSEKVYLAPDPDREGEAIAWHLEQLLEVEPENVKRIEFNEITKHAVQDALNHPRQIDLLRVNAQQARRILDRLVGYRISPLLWKNVRRGLSAGRVQSAAMRLICDREALINVFVKEEYWSIAVLFSTEKEELIQANLISRADSTDPDTKVGTSKLEIKNEEQATGIVQGLTDKAGTVKEVKKKERSKYPTAPFITSTLQQEASRKLGYNARKTMVIAQQLYEGVDLEGETVGLITYMRTDSVRIADEALNSVRKLIGEKFGSELLPADSKFYKTKKSAQDAHEAIRPTDVFKEPNNIKNVLTPEQFKIYGLIWKRFVACQMKPALMDQTSIDITAGDYLLRATGSVIKFPGFMSVYLESEDEEVDLKNGKPEENILPEVTEGQNLNNQKINPVQHFTQPPPRFTEASLVKTLEEQGIGRPSTYAPTISTIQYRGYVERQGKTLFPTDLGIKVNGQLVKHFPGIVDIHFTANVEDELDKIIEGTVEWTKVLKDFYFPFEEAVKKAEIEMENIKEPDVPTDQLCDKCGKPMVIKVGRFGQFLACSGFPDCKNTKTVKKVVAGVKCPKCGGDMVEKMTRRRTLFYGCGNYPKCTFGSWDKPIAGENCPKCGAFMVEKKKKDQEPQKLCIMCDIKSKEKVKSQKSKVKIKSEKGKGKKKSKK